MKKLSTFLVLASFLTGVMVFGRADLGYSKEPAGIAPAAAVQKVNVNKANREELESVRGIGPVLAQRILDHRNAQGPFKTVDDVAQVNGIGSVKYEKMKDQLTV